MTKTYKLKTDEKIFEKITEDEIFDLIYEGKLTGKEKIQANKDKKDISLSEIPVFSAALKAYQKTNVSTDKEENDKTTITQTIATIIDRELKEDDDSKYLKKDEDEFLSSEAIDPYSESSKSIPSMAISSPKPKNTAVKALGFTILMTVLVLAYMSYFGVEKTKEFYAGRYASVDTNLFSVGEDLITIELPLVDSEEYNVKKSKRLFKESIELLAKDNIKAYRKAEEKLQEAHVLDIDNKSIISVLAYTYVKLYYVSKMDSDYINILSALITRASHGDMDLQTITLAQVAYQNLIGNYDYAVSIFNNAISLLKNTKLQPLLLIEGAEAYIGKKDTASALAILDKLDDLNDAYPKIMYLKGVIAEKDDEIKALEYYTELLQVHKTHIASDIKVFLKKTKYTLDSFYNISKKADLMNLKEASQILNMYGDFVLKEGKKDLAILSFQHAIQLYKENEQAVNSLRSLGIQVNLDNGKQDTVLLKKKSDASLFLMRGDELFSVQKYRDAALQYRMAASMDTTDANIWFKLGEAYRKSFEYSKAVSAFVEGLRHNKISVPLLTRLAQVEIDLFNFTQAYKRLQKAELLDPQNPDVIFTLGYLFDKRRNDDKAINYYHKALSNDFSHFESLLALAKKHYKFKSYDDSLLLFKKVLSVKPDYYEAYIYIASIKAKTEGMDKVKRYIESKKKSLSSVPELDLAIAVAYMEQKNYDEAEIIMKKLRKEYKYSLIVIRYYAKLLLKQARITEYLAYLNLITILAPYDLEVRFQDAITYCNTKKIKICEKRLQDILKLTPYYPKAALKLGEIYYASGQFADAENALKTEIEYNPGIKESYLLLGEIYLETNRAEKSVELFRNMLAHNPNDPYGFLGLARGCYYSGDFDCSKEFIAQAKAVDPDITEIYFLECELFYKLNLFSESRSACKTFLRRAPKHFGAKRASKILMEVS